MHRYLLDELTSHYAQRRQMVFLSGPRQVGKTTLCVANSKFSNRIIQRDLVALIDLDYADRKERNNDPGFPVAYHSHQPPGTWQWQREQVFTKHN